MFDRGNYGWRHAEEFADSPVRSPLGDMVANALDGFISQLVAFLCCPSQRLIQTKPKSVQMVFRSRYPLQVAQRVVRLIPIPVIYLMGLRWLRQEREGNDAMNADGVIPPVLPETEPKVAAFFLDGFEYVKRNGVSYLAEIRDFVQSLKLRNGSPYLHAAILP